MSHPVSQGRGPVRHLVGPPPVAFADLGCRSLDGLTRVAAARATSGHAERGRQRGDADGLEQGRETVLVASGEPFGEHLAVQERKSTRLNSSHVIISYAVFCLTKT